MIGRLQDLLGADPQRTFRWVGGWLVVPLLAGVALAAFIDPAAPPVFGRERLVAVVLLDGQAYFGTISDSPLADTIELRDVYYLQDAQGTSTGLAVGLVKRGAELHQPAEGMRIRRDKVLAIETVGPASQVAAAIAADRTLRETRQ